MNSLLVNAGIPQLRVKALAGGRFVYEQKITPCAAAANYQCPMSRVDVEKHWTAFNALAGVRGLL